jgi:hypothetical protein
MKTNSQEVYRVICDANLDAEELEPVIAPKLGANHNETFVSGPTALDVEELEAVIAPKIAMNHNETFVSAPACLI